MFTDTENEFEKEEEKKEKEEQLFEYFVYLPMEIKLKISKAMELKDKFRFARCSKLCWNLWAMAIKYQPCSLKVRACNNIVVLSIEHSEIQYPLEGKLVGFELRFENGSDGKKYIKYKKLEGKKQLWCIEVDNSFDVIQIGLNHFKKALKFYEYGIKELTLDGSILNEISMDLDYNIENSKQLESLNAYDGVDIRQWLKKTHHPLKELSELGYENGVDLGPFEQIYQVQDYIHLSNTFLNYQQFLRLSAKIAVLEVDNFTEQDICNFVTFWKKGMYTGRIEKCEWFNFEGRLDVFVLCGLLGEEWSRYKRFGVKFEQIGTGRKAILSSDRDFVRFEVILEDDDDSDEQMFDENDIFGFLFGQ